MTASSLESDHLHRELGHNERSHCIHVAACIVPDFFLLACSHAISHALQRDLHHWIPLLNHFDDYLEKLLYGRAEMDLRDISKEEPAAEFPKRNVLSILTTTCTLLRICLHKQLYNSLEVCYTK